MPPEPERLDDITGTNTEILQAATLYIQDSRLILQLSEGQTYVAISVGASGVRPQWFVLCRFFVPNTVAVFSCIIILGSGAPQLCWGF